MTPILDALLLLASVSVILLLPGAAVAAALRLRGLTAVAMAPALSVSIITVSATVAPLLDLRWGWWVPALGTAVVVGSLVLLAGLRRHNPRVGLPAGQSVGAPEGREAAGLSWGLAGAAVAAVLIGLRLAWAAPDLDAITQNFDTVFHLNAVHYALETGNASSWHIGEFTRPGAESPSPYPGAWHALVALLVQLSGSSIAAATNAMWLAVAALLWPVSALLLTRTLIGPKPAVLAAAGVLTSAFAAFPFLLLYYGSVYPNALSYAVIPTGIALVIILLREARTPPVPRPMAGLLLVLYLPAQVLSQPNGLFSVAFLLTPLLVMLLFRWFRAGFRTSTSAGLLRSGLVLGTAAALLGVLLTNATFRNLFSWAHPKSMPFTEALWRAAMNFPVPTWWPSLLLSALVLYGLFRLTRVDGRGWMIGTFGLIVLVYALAIGSDNELGNRVIAPWYGNPERLAALMPLVAVPWAAVGLEHLVTAVRNRLRRAGPMRPAPLTVLVAAALLAIGSPTLWHMNIRLAESFTVTDASHPDRPLDTDELMLLRQLDEYLPDDAVLANNPWNGSALAVAVARRDVLFPYMSMGALDADRALLRSELDTITTSDQVCAAARRLGVTHVLDFGDELIGAAEGRDGHLYPGIDRAAASAAFEQVLAVGDARLLELPGCGPSAPAG